MDSKGLKRPVSESDKMEASVLGCRLSEKVEHLPIKKRRFLFMNSSPPLNTSSSEGTQSAAVCLQSSTQNAHPKPDANCPPAGSLTVVDFHQSESNDSKLDVQKFVKYSKKTIEKEDISGTSVGPSTLEFKAKSVKLENISAKDTAFHILATPSKDVTSFAVDNSTPDKLTLDKSSSHAPSESECTKRIQVTSSTPKSAALDDRLNWDLNTVMAWEEQLECDHNMNMCKEHKSEHSERGRECGSISKNIGKEISPVELKSLIPKIEKSELEERKPVCSDMRKLLPPFINSALPVTVNNKINSLCIQHAGSSIRNAVPSALTLKYPVHEVSAKQVNVKAASTDFTFMPLGLGHGMDGRASEENIISSKIVGSGSNVNLSIPRVQTTENDKLKLSLVTAPSFENEVHQNQSTFDEDDKANVKRVITSNGIAMGNLISRGIGSSQNIPVSSKGVDCGNEELNLSLVTAASTETVGHQSGSIFYDEDDKAKVKRINANKGITMENSLATVSSMHDVVCPEAEAPLQSGKSHADFPNDIISNNKEVCDYENFPSDNLAGSEVDNVDEVSFGYDDPQFEDGEFRESSIQTWEGNDREDREIEHGTENRGAFGTHENDSLKSTDVGSQKGTDEISSVLLPEKPDSSDQIYDSEPILTENCTTEVNMKEGSQSDRWNMNVPGSDHLPEKRSFSSNNIQIKDFNSIKSSPRVTGDFETKAEVSRFYRRIPSTRDAFLSRGRFRIQGSSSNADDSASRPVRNSGVTRSVGRGKYARGLGTWDRSRPFPGPSFRRPSLEADNLTDKVDVDPNVTRGSFRSRLIVNSEEDEFRARLGLRPTGDTGHNRYVNMGRGRGRSLRYGSRHNDVGPRERYYGHSDNDEPSMDYSQSFPARRRCFSPTHHHSGSTSPLRSRTRSPVSVDFRVRSRSPLRSDTRMQREPNYRHGFEPDQVGRYNSDECRNNNSHPSSRFLKYKQRSFVFDRRSPPQSPSGERLSLYESSRKTKQNENYRSSRFSELHGGERDGNIMDHGYRRGGFVRPYDMGRPVKPVQYNEEDGYGPPVYDSHDKETLEFHGRGNRDLPRRGREDRDKW